MQRSEDGCSSNAACFARPWATSPHAMVLGLWRAVFDRARESGELRGDLSDDDLIESVMTIHYVLLLRGDVDQQRQRQLLELFVVPALLAGAATPSKRATRRKQF